MAVRAMVWASGNRVRDGLLVSRLRGQQRSLNVGARAAWTFPTHGGGIVKTLIRYLDQAEPPAEGDWQIPDEPDTAGGERE